MKLDGLKFDNGNNACASLHILAELARRGDVVVSKDTPHPKLGEDGKTIWLMAEHRGNG